MNIRNFRQLVLAGVVLAALAACGATTPTTATAPRTAQTAVPPTAAAKPAAATASAVDATAAPASQSPTPSGFKRVVRDGEEYFCQTRGSTGSRARAVEICMTRDQLKQQEEANEQYRKDAQSSGSQTQLILDSPN